MASKVYQDNTVQNMLLGFIAWNHELINKYARQNRRSPSERKDLRLHLAKEGWNSQKGVICIFDAKSPIWIKNPEYKQTLEDTFKARQERYKILKDEITKDAKSLPKLEAFRAMFCDPKSGEVIKPKYLAGTCQGRLEEIEEAMNLRVTGFDVGEDEAKEHFDPIEIDPETFGKVPTNYFIFATEVDRVQKQLSENNKKDGFTEPDTLDKLRSMKMLYDNGVPIVKFRTLYSGTVGIKGGLVCVLDSYWSSSNKYSLFPGEGERPDVHIVERCLLTGKVANKVSFPSMNNTVKLVELIDRSDPKKLENRNRKIREDNDKARSGDKSKTIKDLLEPLTLQELEEFLGDKSAQRSNQQRGLGKATWEGYKNGQGGVDMLAPIAVANLDGNTDLIASKFINKKEAWNAVFARMEEGLDQEVLMACQVEVLTSPHFQKFIELCTTETEFDLVEKVVVPVPEVNVKVPEVKVPEIVVPVPEVNPESKEKGSKKSKSQS